MSTATKVGHGLAKVLGIKLDDVNTPDKITRGESVFSVSSADTYVEEEPTVADWLREVVPTGAGVLQYFRNLFPFTRWITRYNLQWLYGDLVAGKTSPKKKPSSKILLTVS
jgi:sodium-independent sulfate anion transporter 11